MEKNEKAKIHDEQNSNILDKVGLGNPELSCLGSNALPGAASTACEAAAWRLKTPLAVQQRTLGSPAVTRGATTTSTVSMSQRTGHGAASSVYERQDGAAPGKAVA